MVCCDLCSSWLGCFIIAVIIYKLLDHLVRKPFLGVKDKYILVTGCDTGFGYEISKRLDGKGAHIFAGCYTEKGEDNLRKQCSSRLKTLKMDVTSPESVRKVYEEVKKSLPRGQGLWAVMNNAGIAGKIGPAEWLRLEDYHECFAVNLYGVIDTTTTFLPLVKLAKGRIVSTASIFGRTALIGGAPYNISKYGVEAFSDGLRRQLRDYGCSVHIIEPGFHKTNIASSATLSGFFEATWNRLTPDIKAEYGEEYFLKSKEFIINEFVERIASDRISDVVDAYEHALTGRFPRARYVVGNDAKYFWLPIQWLPEWLGDLIQSLGNWKRPLPAALQKYTSYNPWATGNDRYQQPYRNRRLQYTDRKTDHPS